MSAIERKEAGVFALLGLEAHGEPASLDLEISQKLSRAEGLIAMSRQAETLSNWPQMEPLCAVAGGAVVAVGELWVECSLHDLDLREIEGPTLFEDPEYQEHCLGVSPEPPVCESIRKRVDRAQVDRAQLVEQNVKKAFGTGGFDQVTEAGACRSNGVIEGCLRSGRLLLYAAGADTELIAAEQ